ncbi:cilia- and flagella-associated protein 68-like [Convolutriloba macropyga]|uniref:cilia- and flagella-associated protein 68-like n=1 Tax=Convolutriloba macropyga TaxID=536237 RepID=UPI003F522EF8
MDQASDMCLSRVEPAPFHYEMRATTYGEVFPTNGATTGDVGGVVEEQINDGLKVYGWRSTTQEDTYKKQPGVLIGNWVEEQADLQFRKRIPPLPSDYAHNFDTIYKASYEKPFIPLPKEVRHALEREPFAYPTHQPELDPPLAKQYDPMLSVSMETYTNPATIKANKAMEQNS